MRHNKSDIDRDQTPNGDSRQLSRSVTGLDYDVRHKEVERVLITPGHQLY